MTLHCVVIGCANSTYRLNNWKKGFCDVHNINFGIGSCICPPPFRLFPFPTVLRDNESRERWRAALNKQDKKNPEQLLNPSKDMRVCSRHFVDGMPTSSNPDPTIDLGYSENFRHQNRPPNERPTTAAVNVPTGNTGVIFSPEDTNMAEEIINFETAIPVAIISEQMDIKKEDEGDTEFYLSLKDTILTLCTNYYKDKPVKQIEGYLSLVFCAGEQTDFVINEVLRTDGEAAAETVVVDFDRAAADRKMDGSRTKKKKSTEAQPISAKSGSRKIRRGDVSTCAQLSLAESLPALLESLPPDTGLQIIHESSGGGSSSKSRFKLAIDCKEERLLYCLYCQYPFMTHSRLEIHLKRTHFGDENRCPICSGVVPKRRVLHMFVCRATDAGWKAKRELLASMKNAMLDAQEEEQNAAAGTDDAVGRPGNDDDVDVASEKGDHSLYKCSYCQRLFWTGYGLSRHARLKHGREPEPTVSETEPIVDRVRGRPTTTANGGETVVYFCPECQRRFSAKDAFARHMNRTHGYSLELSDAEEELAAGGGRMGDDDAAPQIFKMSDVEEEVVVDGQTNDDEKKTTRKRALGKKTYAISQMLRQHRVADHKGYRNTTKLNRNRKLLDKAASAGDDDAANDVFECNVCLTSFSSNSDLYRHRVHYHRRHACVYCQVNFAGRIALNDHSKECHAGIDLRKKFICDFCAKGFRTAKLLTDHIQSKHLGIVFPCDICGKTLGSDCSLKIHRKLHDAAKFKRCEICGKRFCLFPSLVQHMRKRHPDSVPERYRIAIRCDDCGQTFTTKDCFRRHVETKHGGKLLVCDICGKVLPTKRHLLRHRRTHDVDATS